jgi:hypothetical protein
MGRNAPSKRSEYLMIAAVEIGHIAFGKHSDNCFVHSLAGPCDNLSDKQFCVIIDLMICELLICA